MPSALCKCGNPRRKGGRYCLDCHAAWSRANRKPHWALTPEAKRRANARSYARVYLRRGQIEREPCRDCGNKKAEMHHPDYSKPLQVVWLCRPCHLSTHG